MNHLKIRFLTFNLFCKITLFLNSLKHDISAVCLFVSRKLRNISFKLTGKRKNKLNDFALSLELKHIA